DVAAPGADIDAVEAASPDAHRCGRESLHQESDLRMIHRVRDLAMGFAGRLRRSPQRPRGIDGGTLVAAMTELSDERRTVLMDGVAEAPQVRNHAVVPIVHLGPGADAAGWVDTGAAETADQAAAALRLADEVAQIFLGRSAVGDES